MGVSSSKLSKLIGRVSRVKRSLRLRSDIPRGYVPICVGVKNDEMSRFIIHTTALGDEDFLKFLCKSAEEYGFHNEGILKIPYEAKEFKDWVIKSANPKVKVKPF